MTRTAYKYTQWYYYNTTEKRYYYTYHSNYGGQTQTKKVYSPLPKAGKTEDGKQRYNSTSDPWYNETVITETVTPAHTEYRTRSRSRSYLIGVWGDWSVWMDEAVEPSEIREVQTRTVSVIDIPDTAVDVRETGHLTMLSGTGTQLAAPGSRSALRWFSQNPAAASVDATGYLTAHAAGETVIRLEDDGGTAIAHLEVAVTGACSNLSVKGVMRTVIE